MFIRSLCAAWNRVIALGDPFKSPIGFKYFNQGHLKKETAVWTGVLHLEAMMERNVYASATPGMERAACPHLLYPHIHNFAKTIICNCNDEFGSLDFPGSGQTHEKVIYEISPFPFFGDKTTLRENLQVRKWFTWFWYMSMNKKLLFPVEEVSLKKKSSCLWQKSMLDTKHQVASKL